MDDRALGLLTLGESPREDVTPTLRAILGDSVRIHEQGGLDGLTPAGLAALAPGPGETPLETRLRSGAAILLARERLLPRLAAAANALAARCRRVLLLCSGEFPALAEACPDLIQPIWILRGAVAAAARNRPLGLVGPASDLAAAPAQWAPYAPDVRCAAASPYQPLGMAEEAGRSLAGLGAEVIYLDDMGFTEAHRAAVARAARRPTLCATTLTAKFLTEML